MKPCLPGELAAAGEAPPRARVAPREGSHAQRPAAGEADDDANLSFDDVYERYFEFVWRSLRLFGVPRESLDDAVQDTFGVIVRQLPQFEGRSTLYTWIYAIVQRVAANYRRGYRRKTAALEPLEHHVLASAEPDAHARAEAREAADEIVRFCSGLEPDRRTLFVLGLLENVPAQEIATLLGIPVNTVYTRTRALRLALREQIERRENEV